MTLTIILDDFDGNEEIAELIKIAKDRGINIIIAIFPGKSDYHGDILHMPMQGSYNNNMKKYRLMVNDSVDVIASKLVKAFRNANVKTTIFNNHEGSAFTSDDIAMGNLAKAMVIASYRLGLKPGNELKFINSRTTPLRTAQYLTNKHFPGSIINDAFIDSTTNNLPLDKANLLGQQKNYTVIGHATLTYIKTLKNIIDAYDNGVFRNTELVGIDDLSLKIRRNPVSYQRISPNTRISKRSQIAGLTCTEAINYAHNVEPCIHNRWNNIKTNVTRYYLGTLNEKFIKEKFTGDSQRELLNVFNACK